MKFDIINDNTDTTLTIFEASWRQWCSPEVTTHERSRHNL